MSPASRARLAGSLSRLFTERRLHLAGLARGLPDPADLLGAAAQRLDDRSERLRLAILGRFGSAKQRLDLAASGLRPAALSTEIGRARDRLGDVERRLGAAMNRVLETRRGATDNFAGRLATHSERHESLLARGYVVVRKPAPAEAGARSASSPKRRACAPARRWSSNSTTARSASSPAARGGRHAIQRTAMGLPPARVASYERS